MAKIKTPDQYRQALKEYHEIGRNKTESAQTKAKELEGETSDYAQKLHAKEAKGRPKQKTP
jgi:hypothetical protein